MLEARVIRVAVHRPLKRSKGCVRKGYLPKWESFERLLLGDEKTSHRLSQVSCGVLLSIEFPIYMYIYEQSKHLASAVLFLNNLKDG